MLPIQEALHQSHRETGVTTKIIAWGTAVPRLKLTQEETLDFILKNFGIKDSTRQLYKRTLLNKSIHTRHFALEKLSDILDRDHERVNARFEKEAIQLSVDSLGKALAAAHLTPKDVDYLAVATCTGYLCPGLAPQIIE